MTHLLLGIDPRYIRVDPYIPAATHFPWIKASNIGIRIASGVYLRVSPCVSSYVGGDIVAGVLASGMFNSEKMTLYIDIGTNGEMVLGNKDWLLSCSCSAGPAFEGAGVKHGMRATRGAIEQVRINEVSKEPMIITVGNRRPVGICGSGLIDVLAELFLTGVMDERGKIDVDLDTPRTRQSATGGEYVLAWADESGTNRDIVVTDVDIDNLMRAKAAIYAGIQILVQEVGLEDRPPGRDTDRRSLRPLPRDRQGDNHRAAAGRRHREDQVRGERLAARELPDGALQEHRSAEGDRIANMMTYLELSTNPRFMDQYISALFLPHTDIEEFPTVSAGSRRPARPRELGTLESGGGSG